MFLFLMSKGFQNKWKASICRVLIEMWSRGSTLVLGLCVSFLSYFFEWFSVCSTLCFHSMFLFFCLSIHMLHSPQPPLKSVCLWMAFLHFQKGKYSLLPTYSVNIFLCSMPTKHYRSWRSHCLAIKKNIYIFCISPNCPLARKLSVWTWLCNRLPPITVCLSWTTSIYIQGLHITNLSAVW